MLGVIACGDVGVIAMGGTYYARIFAINLKTGVILKVGGPPSETSNTYEQFSGKPPINNTAVFLKGFGANTTQDFKYLPLK
jgi:hypothetical protein